MTASARSVQGEQGFDQPRDAALAKPSADVQDPRSRLVHLGIPRAGGVVTRRRGGQTAPQGFRLSTEHCRATHLTDDLRRRLTIGRMSEQTSALE
jgi:hypothetical protein